MMESLNFSPLSPEDLLPRSDLDDKVLIAKINEQLKNDNYIKHLSKKGYVLFPCGTMNQQQLEVIQKTYNKEIGGR